MASQDIIQRMRIMLITPVILAAFFVNILCFWNLMGKLLLRPSSIDQVNLPPDDLRTLVDYRDFDYLVPKPRCVFHSDEQLNIKLPYFIVLVHSATTNVERRNAIRDTWGHSDTRSKTFFLLGATNSSDLQAQIKEEDAEFGDIIQGNFVDSIRNSTYKYVMGLKWFTYNCAGAKYLVKMDDDVFINTPNVLHFLVNNQNPKDFLMGKYLAQLKPVRAGENAITDEEYPPKYLPVYASGFAVIYSGDVAIRLYLKSRKMKFFWVDDIYANGFLRLHLNVGITDITKYILDERSLENVKNKNKISPLSDILFSCNNLTTQDQQILWAKTEWVRLGRDRQLRQAAVSKGRNMKDMFGELLDILGEIKNT